MTAPLPPLSAVTLIAEVFEAASAELSRIGDERGLSAAELAELDTFEALLAELAAVLPASRGIFLVAPAGSPLSTGPVKEHVQRCIDASNQAIPLVDLLGLRSAIPADWRNLPLDMDLVLWLGATRLAGDLALICASGPSGAEREAELATIRGLQSALGHVIEATRSVAKAEATLVRAFHRTIRRALDVTSIHAEAAAVRSRRQ
jgi:hypothetical protein